MLCNRCGEREATIHEVVIRNGQARERHLCEVCAKQAGIQGGSVAPINELLSKFVEKPEGAVGPASGVASDASAEGGTPAPGTLCGGCGLTYPEFKQSGLVGCSRCYASFESRLGPLIERAHEGGTHHVGKLPQRALAQSRAEKGDVEALVGGIEERAERASSIRKQLAKAVEEEQYERAAKLRDELSRLTALGAIDDADREGDESENGGAG